MPRPISCPACSQPMTLDDGVTAPQVLCPRCGATVSVDAPNSAPSAAPTQGGAMQGGAMMDRLALIGGVVLLGLFLALMLLRWHWNSGIVDFTLLFFLCAVVFGAALSAVFRPGYFGEKMALASCTGTFSFFVVLAGLFWTTGIGSRRPPRVDVVLLLDITGSMQPEIDSVKAGMRNFALNLLSRDLDARIAVIGFRDQFDSEASVFEIPEFSGNAFTNDPVEFSVALGKMRARAGGDNPESSLDAIAKATRLPFRSRATRVLVLITDAAPKLPDKEMRSLEDAAGQMSVGGIQQLHLIVNLDTMSTYKKLQTLATGKSFPLTRVTGEHTFSRIFPEMGQHIGQETLNSLRPGLGMWLAFAANFFVIGLFSFLAVRNPRQLPAGLDFPSGGPAFFKQHGLLLVGQIAALGLGVFFVVLAALGSL